MPSLDVILHHITTSNNHAALNHTIRSALPKDVRDPILASPLATGQDPLSVLDVRENTLGMLYIMCVNVAAICILVGHPIDGRWAFFPGRRD